MDKQLLEMMGKLMEEMTGMRSEMNEIRSEMTGMRSEMNEVRSEMTGMRSEINEIRSEMNARFDAVDVRITSGFTEIGELFASADKRFDTVEDLTKKIATRDVKFLKHKMNKLEEDVFLLSNDN